MKNYTISLKQTELGITLSLLFTICAVFIPVVGATNYDYEVPYMNQKNYDNIGESACGPTSIAMILKFYYPNITITGEDVYHSGTQGYTYNGPAVGYKNVGFATDKNNNMLEKGTTIVDKEFQNYYRGSYLGLYSGLVYGNNYLKNYWGGTSDVVYGFPPMTEEIKNRPVVVNIRNAITPGHYIVLRGYDDHNTPEITDDTYYVNDPYPGWLGENGAVSYSTLKDLYKNRIITYVPSLDAEHRKYTILVDGNRVQLDDINAKTADGKYIWQEYYGGGGDWYYPIVGGRSVTWTPELKQEGRYEIHAIFNDIDHTSGDIEYSVYSPENPDPIATKLIKISNAGWRDETLGTFDLKKGSYVKVNNVPAQCNVDAVRFEYVESSIPASPKPDVTEIDPSQVTAGDFDLTINGSNFDSDAIDQIYLQSDGHFVGNGTLIKDRTSTSLVVAEHLTTPGVYLVRVKNSDGQESTASQILTVTEPIGKFTPNSDLNLRVTNVDAAKFQNYFTQKNRQSMNPLSSALVEAGNKHNMNSIFLMALAAHESAWGSSNFASTRNNFFGYGALYEQPDLAWQFSSPTECADAVAGRIKADYLLNSGTYTILVPTQKVDSHYSYPYKETLVSTGKYYAGSSISGWIVHYNLNSQSEMNSIISIMNDFASWHLKTYGYEVQIDESGSKNPPDITKIDPPQVTAGDFDLTINGSNFDSGATDQIYLQYDGHFVGNGTAIRNRSETGFVVTEHLTTPGIYLVKIKNSDGQESTTSQILTVTEPVIPVTLSVSPTSGQQGTKFTFSGNGYTPNGAIEWHVRKPDSIEFPVGLLTASNSGVLSYSYQSTTESMIGTYTIWAIDKSTGQKSNEIGETITAAPSPADFSSLGTSESDYVLPSIGDAYAANRTADSEKPSASFYANVTSGPAPLKVLFTSSTTGNPSSYFWQFEPSTSNDWNSKHPITALHTFKNPGTYTVSLTVSNDAGNTTIKKDNYITVT